MLDLTDVKDMEYGTLPMGRYHVKVEKAESKDTKDGTGRYLNIQFRVFEGEREGAVIFNIYNTKNKSEKAEMIGLQQLKAMMKASGVSNFQLKSPQDLEGLCCEIKGKPKTDDFGEKFVITSYKPLEGESPAAANSNYDSSDIPF